jgi:hypothetical protein
VRSGDLCYRFRRSFCYKLSAADTSVGPEIDDVVGGLYHIQVVLDNDDARAVVDQRTKRSQQFTYIVKVKAGGRLVKDEERAVVGLLGEVRRELYALGLPAGERGSRLAEP